MPHLVALPEPRPEDDEDVVWGLQTARTLWTRGEQRDAIVWLRRAAEAATAAGQDFRASELGMYATEIEDALTSGPTDGAAAAPPPDTIAEPPRPEPPPARSPLASLDIQLEEEPARVPAAPPPPPGPPPARPPPPTGAPRGFPAAPTLPTGVPPPRGPAAPAPPLPRPAGPPSAAPAAAAAPPPSPSTAPAAFAPPPAPAAPPPAPAAPPPAPAAPPPAPAAPAPGSAHPPSAPPPPPAAAEVASSAPPIAVAAPPPPATGAAPAPSASQPKRKKAKPRAPILDPWSEEPAPSQHVAPAAAPAARTAKVGSRAPEPSMNEEEVVTSAVPLEMALGKATPAARPPPPPRKPAPTLPAVDGAVSSAPPVPPPVPAAAKRSSSAPPAAGPAAERVSPPAAPAPRAHVSEAVSSAPPLSASAPAAGAAPAAVSAPPPPVTPPPAAAPGAPPTGIAPAVGSASPLIASKPPPPAPAAAATTTPAVPAARDARDAPPASMRATVPDLAMAPRSEGRIAVTGVPVPQKATVQPRVDPVPPLELPEEKRSVGGLALDAVDALADLPHEIQASLAASAKVEALRPDEEVAGFGAALMLEGEGLICATITDAPAHRAPAPALIAARGTLADGLAIRIVAGAAGARVAVWDQGFFDQALKSCPWVLDDLREGADRLQALAGATMGPLGDVDEATRALALGRLSLRVLRPNEAFTEQGGPNPGMCIVGVGSIDLLEGGKVKSTLRPGDPVFAAEFLRAAPAAAESRAGEAGAILFCAERSLAQELLVSVPPLIEMFSG